jgi:hypothetical protein
VYTAIAKEKERVLGGVREYRVRERRGVSMGFIGG